MPQVYHPGPNDILAARVLAESRSLKTTDPTSAWNSACETVAQSLLEEHLPTSASYVLSLKMDQSS